MLDEVRRILPNFRVQRVIAQLLAEGGPAREQVGAQAQPVSLDLKAHGRQHGGKEVHSRKFPVARPGRKAAVQKAVVDRPVIVRYIFHQIGIHAGVVPGHDNDGVLIKVLFPAPGEEVRSLPVRAGDSGGGNRRAVIRIIAASAQGADLSAHMVGVHGEHGKIKRPARLRQVQKLVLGDFIEVHILKPPPAVVITTGNIPGLPGGVEVKNLVASVPMSLS